MHDYRGRRATPNVTFVVNPAAGANPGLVTLVVRTRNGSGISANMDLLLDLGESYIATHCATEHASKRFRGALDLLLDKQWQQVVDTAGLMLVSLFCETPLGSLVWCRPSG